jgi:hypothetical protein
MIASQYTACSACYCGYYDITTASMICLRTQYHSWSAFYFRLICKNKTDKNDTTSVEFDHMRHHFRDFGKHWIRFRPYFKNFFQDSYLTNELEYLVGIPYLSFSTI